MSGSESGCFVALVGCRVFFFFRLFLLSADTALYPPALTADKTSFCFGRVVTLCNAILLKNKNKI